MDGCTIGENPLSKDGRFLHGMGFPARDRWSIVFIKFRAGWLDARSRDRIFSVVDVFRQWIVSTSH